MSRSVAVRQRVGGRIEARDILDLTLAIDHKVVDGAPATRFAAELGEIIETAAVISPLTQAAAASRRDRVRAQLEHPW
jgi:pyruvate/2-oxoglutarate dehydrogenase complex dihydrolipoamide acyltransferase (E2) component